MDRGILAPRAGRLFPLFALALSGVIACASLEEVPPGCGNQVVEETEDCDGLGTYLCGAQDTQHQCRFVWDETHGCPAGYAASPDKRCRKGSGELIVSASIETPGSDPQVADLGGDGTLELGMTEGFGSSLTLYSVSGAVSDRLVSVPTFGAVAMGEISGDASADIVAGTEAVSGVACAQPTEGGGGEPTSDDSARAGLSVLRSVGDSFSLKVYANSTYGEAVRFTALPSWLFGSCEVFDLDVLTRMALVDAGLELCAVDDCENTKAVFQGAVAEAVLSLDSNDAYAVVSVQGQSQLLYVPREGFSGLADAFENPTFRSMPAGTAVEAGIVLADVNDDQLDDVVVIGAASGDGQGPWGLYVLHGAAPLVGETFASLETDTLKPWFEIENFFPADNGGTVFESGDLNGDTIPDFFLGDRVLVSTGEPIPDPPTEPLATYYRTECWVSSQLSFGDAYCGESRAASIGDVNGDGLDDIVGTGGEFGAWTLQVLYGGDSLPLVRVQLPTEALGTGLVARVGLADFDGDGAADILGSFVPTQDGEPVESADPCSVSESLLIAYGNVGALPDAPSVIAKVPAVRQIAAGKFRSPADGFGDFAVAIKCGSSATLIGDPYRRISSPFLFDDVATSAFRPYQVSIRDVVASEDDLRDENDNIVPHADLIVAGSTISSDFKSAVLLVPSSGDAVLSLSTVQVLEPPARWRDAYTLALEPVALGVEAQSGLVGMAGIALSFEFDDVVPSYGLTGDWAIAKLAGDGELATTALPFPESELLVELAVDEQLGGAPFARVAMADLNGDQVADFVVVYGVPLGSFDGFTGSDSVGASSAGRVVSRVVLALSDGDAYVAKAVSGLDVSDDAPVDVVVLDGKLLVVAEQSLYTIDAVSGVASFAAPLGLEVLAKEAVVGDFSSDGLADLMVFDGSRGYLLEQLPLKP